MITERKHKKTKILSQFLPLIAAISFFIIVFVTQSFFLRGVQTNATASAINSMLKISEISSVFGPSAEGYYAVSNGTADAQQLSTTCPIADFEYASVYTLPDDIFTNQSAYPRINKTLPIVVYSNFLKLSNTSFVGPITSHCFGIVPRLMSKEFVQNYSVSNLTLPDGASAVLFSMSNFTPEGLSFMHEPNGTPPDLSWQFTYFLYKNLIVRVGVWSFTKQANVTKLVTLTNYVNSMLLNHRTD